MAEEPESEASETSAAEAAEAVVPQAVVTEAIVPQAVVPEVEAPEALVPEAIVPNAVAPEAVVSETIVPEALVPKAVPANADVAGADVPRKENKLIDRPFRVKLRGSVLALLRLPNRRDVRSAIHQLSTTGGVIHLEKPLDENLTVEMVFHMNGATIRAKAQLLFPMWATQGWMQPFRFLELSDESRQNLNASLKSLVGDKTSTATAGV
jgi:hypothetical protein